MYKKIVWKYGSPYATYTEREKVVSDFLEDVTNCRPAGIQIYKTRMRVAFTDGKFTAHFILPVRFKTYLKRDNEK